MKGPGLRIDLDVRRVWRCPRCGRTTRTAGHVVAQRCHCTEGPCWMRLEQPARRPAFVPPPHAERLEEDSSRATSEAQEDGEAAETAAESPAPPPPADGDEFAAGQLGPEQPG